LTGLGCFMDPTCDQADALNYSEASYGGFLAVKSDDHALWR